MTVPAATPSCWRCGYDLTGMRVEEVCPECGTPVWSRPVLDADQMRRDAGRAQTWGIVAAASFLVIGPLAGLIAIPAITGAARLKRRCEGVWPPEYKGARTAWWLGWITAALSIAVVVPSAVIYVIGLF